MSHTKPYKSFDALGWKIRERIYKEKRNNILNKNTWKTKKVCTFLRENKKQKGKAALRNLRNKKRQINHKWDKTKIWIATDADKNDAIFEYIKKHKKALCSLNTL